MRIAIFAHNHPDLIAGGAERAAYSLFTYLKTIDGIDPIFVARCKADQVGHDGAFGAFRGRKDEIIWSPPVMDLQRLCSGDAIWFSRQLTELCALIKPDLIHVQHYVHFGVDLFTVASKQLGIPTVLTLHEYLPICHNQGQMYKTSKKLCHQASPAECADCFPETTAGKFFLRETFIKDSLAHVSHFVSPSHFLIDRYKNWGMDSSKFSMIENIVPQSPTSHDRPEREDGKHLKLGFFGQVNPFKGLHILLDALLSLKDKELKKISVTIFGANLDIQEDRFKKLIKSRLKKLHGIVNIAGSYRNEDVIDLMNAMDWAVIPSIWWENSPLVIQEAAIARTPILGSNIGGMKEKIIPGVTGEHFMAGSALDLASKIRAILKGELKVTPPALDIQRENISRANANVEIYKRILS